MSTNTLRLLVYLSLSLVPYASSLPGSRLQRRQFDDRFDWASVAPKHQLQYHECYDGYKCARLQVPLDWTEGHPPSNASLKAAIGIITLPATVPETDPSFGGTILINPGGPGGSGTEMTLELGAYIQSILDGDKHYEILGFDPRGVALSTPRADCYNDEFDRAADAFQKEGLPSVVAGPEGLAHQYQAAKGVGELCAELGPGSIFNFMSTASVARDMVEIVDRVHELRQHTTNRSGATSDEQPKLQYLGVSYGTILGNTFASMFPDRVGRMVLDGVADADDYVQGTWFKNLIDTEAVVDRFYQTCFEAGNLCALRHPPDSSAADIRGRVDAFISSLIDSPVSFVYEGRVRLVTSVIARDTIRQALYSPIRYYEPLSVALAEALVGNYSLLFQGPAVATFPRDEVCRDSNASYPPADYTWSNEAGSGILCGDSAYDAGERNVSWAQGIVDVIDNQSFTAGEPWSRIGLACSGWSFQPKYVFRGPFGVTGNQAGNSSSASLLVLSNRLDHATPLANAKALALRYPGSKLLIQESVGHCALITSKSACTARHVRAYFDSGELPADGATCEEDCSPRIPFEPCPGFVE